MVASSFARALNFTLKFEGGYSDNPRDPGGATNLGITQHALECFRDHPVTKDDVKALKQDEAAKIYRQNYWNSVCCDQMPAGTDMCLFDLAVNSGPQKAIKILQASTGLRVNGILTAATLSAAQKADPHLLISAICQRRLSFLQRLAIFATFGRGWSKRVLALEQEAKALIPQRTTIPPTETSKETTMNDVKSLFQSRTIWSNIIGLSAITIAHFGIDVSTIDQSKVLDSVVQIIAAGGFISSSIFRIFATKKLF
jgi:lysozyme family protein